ncbi:cytochrome P450 [Catenulispora rubra]|uniref:cytochrome P450 n=1 Tax=Catenulispora rubra TaxID=280293 RepID=UPI001892095B|nr:cytochrome P450 [Catenulispora rubra]
MTDEPDNPDKPEPDKRSERDKPPAFPFPHPPSPQPPARFAELTAEPGLPRVVLSNGASALLVSRYADVRAVLSDDRFSRASFTGKPMFARSNASLALATSDPPVHSRRRQAVASEFTARRARETAPWLRDLAASSARRLRSLPQPADLVEEFTVPFALRTGTEQLGLPYDEAVKLRPAMAVMMSFGSHTPEEVATAHAEVHGYFRDLVAQRLADAAGRPNDDLLTRLLHGKGADRLSHEEVAVFGAGLLMAGFDTTSRQLAMAVQMVLRDPALTARLRQEPGALTPALEEILRWTSLIATGGAAHVALEDVRLGDVLVPAGEVVVPLTAAANQDASIFAEPDRFDPGREDNPHIAFGHGRHYCLGASLARLQLEVGMAALLAEFPTLQLAVHEDQIRWTAGQFIRGPLALPVRWDGAGWPGVASSTGETTVGASGCPWSPDTGSEEP